MIMKNVYRFFAAILLLLSMVISISGCLFLGDQNNSDTNSADSSVSETENGENQSNGSSESPSTDENSGENNSDATAPDNEGGENDNGASDEEETNPEDTFVPDMTKENLITDTRFPHLNYSSVSQNAYNKELFYRNSYEVPLGDPSVFVQEENGVTWFYVTGTTTGEGFEMWKTTNFTDWIKIGTVYSPSEGFFGVKSFWAPQLYYDADADRKYYLGNDAEEGKGLYILFFSARNSSNVCKLSVAFSEKITGPYKNFVGTNANGDYVDETQSVFELENLKGLGLYANHKYGDLYKQKRSFIDASPFVDPKTGEKYLYMVRSRNVDVSNDVWGVKMKDWVTPDYSTTTPLTSYGYVDIEKSSKYEYLSTSKIDEGPFLYYKDPTDDGIPNGKYYLTFSIGDTDDKIYPVCQAISDSPLGPFTKIQPSKYGMLNHPELNWNIHGSGHHAFFEVDGELYIAYHTYEITSGSSIGRRYFAFDKVEWIYNSDGEYVMRSNGPTTTPQPLPSAVSGYNNVAQSSVVTVNGLNNEHAKLLTDGIIALREGDEEMLFTFSESTVISFEFDEWISARAIMIYNSFDFATAFLSIDKIELSYRTVIDGRIYFGTAVINYVPFNFKNNLIPKSYLEAQGESDYYQLCSASAAIVEFNDVDIKGVKIHLNNNGQISKTAISEIIILGKESDGATDSLSGFGGYTSASKFDSYTSFTGTMPEEENSPENTIVIDGILDDDIWKKHATATVIEGAAIDSETKQPVDVSLYGERRATVYTYVGTRNIYFAFDVIDKNLFFNSSQPQGRSTCVEIYFTTANNTSLEKNCYSIRINPTGYDGAASCKVGIYVGREDGSEWRYSEISYTVTAVSVVHGSVQSTKYDSEYDSSKNTGYTVEIAIDKILLGLDADSMRFTAAFVQDRGYDEPRIANTFIGGTHYLRPVTWIIFKNKSTY